MSSHDVFPQPNEAEYRQLFDKAKPQPREPVSFPRVQDTQYASEHRTSTSFPVPTAQSREGATVDSLNQPSPSLPQTLADFFTVVGQQQTQRRLADLPTQVPLSPEAYTSVPQPVPGPMTPTTNQPIVQVQINTSPPTWEPGSQSLVHIYITTSAPSLSTQVAPSLARQVPAQQPLSPPPLPQQASFPTQVSPSLPQQASFSQQPLPPSLLPQQASFSQQQRPIEAVPGWGPPSPYSSRPPLIIAEEVCKVIESPSGKLRILDNLSFLIPSRSLFAINGPSGSGKSTLLNLLTGIDQPTSGRITFSGREMGRMNENALAKWRGKSVGIVFQFFQLLPTLTAQENILLALELGRTVPRQQWRMRARDCLDLVGLGQQAHRLPSALSGGQQQRVAIARAVANDPPVLVADEPTGNLDSKAAYEIFSIFERLVQQGKTVIYVTHDRDLAKRATDRLDLLDGTIVSVGPMSTEGNERRDTLWVR